MELISMLTVIVVLVLMIAVSLKDKRNEKKEFYNIFKLNEEKNNKM